MTNVTYNTIAKFHEIDDVLIEQYLDYQEIMHESDKQDHILRSRDYRRKQIRVKPSPQQTIERYIAFADDKIVGSALSSFRTSEQETNADSMWVDIFVIPQFRQQGISKKFLTLIIDFAKRYSKTKLEAGFFPTDNEFSATYIVDKLGFKHGFNEQVSRIYREKINWEYIEAQEEKLHSLTEKYEILGLGRKEYATMLVEDEEMTEKLADFFTEADNLLPRENAEWNDVVVTANDMRINGQRLLDTIDLGNSYQFIAFDNGNPVAYSGTYYPNDPPVRDVGTGLTAVRKAYQGQGIAKYLKIKILRYYVDNHPDFEYIFTENAGSNAGMLHINHSLGFKHHTDWDFYQGTVATIESYLSRE